MQKSTAPWQRFNRLAPLAILFFASTNLFAEGPVNVSLDGGSVVPTVRSTATGSGKITVLADRTLSGSIKTSGLTATMAHIHEAAIGKNGPPIITLSKTANDGFAIPANARLTDAQYMSYMVGKLYIDVHSAQYPDGEIRGQVPAGKPMRLAN